MGLGVSGLRLQRSESRTGEAIQSARLGSDERGEKHVLTIEDAVQVSACSCRRVLLDLKERGVNVAELALLTMSRASGQR